MHATMHAEDNRDLIATADRTARMIAPLWPLAASVAVNPYLGHTHERLAVAAATLARAAGIPLTMPRRFYRDKLLAGKIAAADIAAALAACRDATPDLVTAEVLAELDRTPAPARALLCVADLSAAATGTDWPSLIADRVSAWAGGFFDEGQAMWPAQTEAGVFASWRNFACHDLSPEIAGLTGFAEYVARAPSFAPAAIRQACRELGISPTEAESYFLGRLHALGGWAQLARYRQWQAELAGTTDETAVELLAVALTWEAGLLAAFGGRVGKEWEHARPAFAAPLAPSRDMLIDCILQDAFDLAAQRALIARMDGGSASAKAPSVQAVFCIDVRSERYRRVLETCDPTIETLGFAGFFGIGVAHRRFGSGVAEARLPVLMKPALTSFSCDAIAPASEEAHRIASRMRRAWGRFKLAAVSSFAFVEASGPAYVAKLLKDAFAPGYTPKVDPAPALSTALTLEQKTAAAAVILGAMSLTRDFAPIVLLVGHGASVANNPHAAALQCGACGGHAGDVNARLVAALLNDKAVQAELVQKGISVPETTLFVGALHDTTTDDVTLFDSDCASPGYDDALARVRQTLSAAAKLARAGRAPLLPGMSSDKSVMARAMDWAQVRPEWGLVGCRAFIAAPREQTRHLDLDGQAFLHSYDWTRDKDFVTLELILTAPVVVASWISLQYYGSTVSPATFGAGNKLIHNVIGGVGVLEGQGGLLRGGLPWQSVHDGKTLAHEPLRLAVIIAAPREAIASVLELHREVGALFDNGWLALYAMDDDGIVSDRYTGHGRWAETRTTSPVESAVAA
ncbi:MAG: hypothetical protein ABS35_42810 [Kaistia sp. SCN 65-12]|nr:MAG: hypothetical protein ABS35_42810 [Kaistia sp. SCN 65-12]